MEFGMLEIMIRVALVLIFSLILTVGTVLVVKLMKIDMKDFEQRTGTKFMLIALLANLLFILTVYLLLKFIDHQDFHLIGLSFSNHDISFSLLAMLITFLVSVLFIYHLNRLDTYEIHWVPQFFLNKGDLLSFILSLMVLFIAALQEEVMFRGYLGFVFQDFTLMKAMLLSTLIFTIWHFIGNKVSIFQTIDWFAGGVILFYVYTLSGSIWVATVVHLSRNLANVFFWNIADKHSLFQWKKPVSPKHKTLYTFTISVLIAFIANWFY